jgi:hypothetical protein
LFEIEAECPCSEDGSNMCKRIRSGFHVAAVVEMILIATSMTDQIMRRLLERSSSSMVILET